MEFVDSEPIHVLPSSELAVESRRVCWRGLVSTTRWHSRRLDRVLPEVRFFELARPHFDT